MADRKRNVLIGAFVLGGLVALGVLVVKFGESPEWFGNRYQISAQFDRIMGVREGTEVDLAGIWAGSVLQVKLARQDAPNEGVIVVMQLDPQFSVPRGSVANVVSPLMGQPKINIIPPLTATPPLPKDGTALILGKLTNPLETVIDPKLFATLDQTAAQIGQLAQALTPAAAAITDLLQKRTIDQVESPEAAARQWTANLSTAIERLYVLLTHIDQVLGNPDVQVGLKETVVNLRTASQNAVVAVDGFRKFGDNANQTAADARRLLAHLDETVKTAHQRVDTLGRKLEGNSDQLAKFLDHLSEAGRQLAEGKGTMGMLLRDSRFYDQLVLTVERLKIAAQDLQVTVKQWQAQGFPVKLK